MLGSLILLLYLIDFMKIVYFSRHWMLAAISPWNGIVFWLDPAGKENEISPFAQRIINEYAIKILYMSTI